MSIEHAPERDNSKARVDRHHNSPPIGERIIRENECHQISGLGRVARWKLEKKGKFPKRIKLTDYAVGWRLSAVLRWIDEREAV